MISTPGGRTHHFHAGVRKAPRAWAQNRIEPQLFWMGSPSPRKLRGRLEEDGVRDRPDE